ncbi:MAG: site-2 protease family protein, partial [Verrucomicrobiota bacterium]
MSYILQLLLWMPIWVVFSVIIHELGHMLGARIAGLRVAYCGVGIQKPLFSFGIGETRYFFGLWPINGLTFIVHDGPRVPVGPMVFAVAAGPLTNLIMGVFAIIFDILQPGVQTGWVMLATVSFLLTLNLLPIRSKGTGFTFRTDGMMILQLLNGTLRNGLSTGVKLRNHELLQELGEQVRSPLAMAAHELSLAYETRRSLGDHEAAEEWLNQAVSRQQLPEWTRAVQEWFGQREIGDPSDVEWLSRISRPYAFMLRA